MKTRATTSKAKAKAATPATLTVEDVAAERVRLGIPEPTEDNGGALRSWLRYQLQRTKNPDTGKPYTQADVARKAFASEASVSIVFSGGRIEGMKGEKIRLVTAEVLGLDPRILWPKRGGESAGESSS
jgi:lambda repressor-like predicted transcriptional regulator